MPEHTPPNTTPFGSAPLSSILSEDVMASLVEKLASPSAASIWSAFATTTTPSTTTGANQPSTGVAHRYGTPESKLDLTRLPTPSSSVDGGDPPFRSLTLRAEDNMHTDLDQQRIEADHMFNAFVQMPPETGTTAADACSAHNHDLGSAAPPPLLLPLPVAPFDDALFRQGTAVSTTPTAAAAPAGAGSAAVNQGPIVPQPADGALAATLLSPSLLMASLLSTNNPAALAAILNLHVLHAAAAVASSHSSASSSSSAGVAAITLTNDQDVPKAIPESVAVEPRVQEPTPSPSPPPSPSPAPWMLPPSRPRRAKAAAAAAISLPPKRRTSSTAALLDKDKVDEGSKESKKEGGGRNFVVKSAEEKEADGQRASSSNDAVNKGKGAKNVVSQDENGKIEVPKTKSKGKGKGHKSKGKNKGNQCEGSEDGTGTADSAKDQHEPSGKNDEAADGSKDVLSKDPADDAEDEPIMLPTNTRKTVTKCPLLPVVLPYPKNMIRPDEPILPPRGSGQKRAREDDNDDDDDSNLTPTEKMLRDRRLRNTISARKSRARKQAKIEVLEAEGTRLAQQLQETEMQVQQLTQLVMAKDQVIMSLTGVKGVKDPASLASVSGAQPTVAISAAVVAALLGKVSALEEHVAHLATEGKGRDLTRVGAAIAEGGEA
ncbi:hypothetical protein GGF31_003824 [Allomyces arbusculus]|nr:hypothetical protein GGF31_003824 [Allomyces arbusculus]